MDIFSLIFMVLTFLIAVTCATNLVPTNTDESKIDRLVVSLLWTGLFLDYWAKFFSSLN